MTLSPLNLNFLEYNVDQAPTLYITNDLPKLNELKIRKWNFRTFMANLTVVINQRNILCHANKAISGISARSRKNTIAEYRLPRTTHWPACIRTPYTTCGWLREVKGGKVPRRYRIRFAPNSTVSRKHKVQTKSSEFMQRGVPNACRSVIVDAATRWPTTRRSDRVERRSRVLRTRNHVSRWHSR